VILFEIILAGLLLSLLTGGSLRRLQEEPLTGEWTLFIVLPLQVMWPSAATRLGLPCAISIVVWLVMMAVLAVVLFYNAWRRWMLAFAGLGIALNILVIGFNGGMPVSLKAAGELGSSREEARAMLETACLHTPLEDGTRLTPLADTIPVPGPPWQRGVVSLGDLMLAAGLGAWVFAAARTRATQGDPHRGFEES
jgi:hypothetical protein